MKNEEKIILDLCGGTGAWSKPYRDAGYEVHVLTLPVWDVCKVEPVWGGLLLVKDDNTVIVRLNKGNKDYKDNKDDEIIDKR